MPDDLVPPDERSRPGGPPTPPRPLLVVGDSLTVGAVMFGGLQAGLAADGWDAEVVAENGRDVVWGVDRVRARRAVPEVVVVGLGTNPGLDPDGFPAHAAALADELVARGARTILWWPPVPLTDGGPTPRAAAVRALAASSPAVSAPDWAAVVTARPDWFDPDGIHYTPPGYAALTTFLRDRLRRCSPV